MSPDSTAGESVSSTLLPPRPTMKMLRSTPLTFTVKDDLDSATPTSSVASKVSVRMEPSTVADWSCGAVCIRLTEECDATGSLVSDVRVQIAVLVADGTAVQGQGVRLDQKGVVLAVRFGGKGVAEHKLAVVSLPL